jgi:hypothetical protein
MLKSMFGRHPSNNSLPAPSPSTPKATKAAKQSTLSRLSNLSGSSDKPPSRQLPKPSSDKDLPPLAVTKAAPTVHFGSDLAMSLNDEEVFSNYSGNSDDEVASLPKPKQQAVAKPTIPLPPSSQTSTARSSRKSSMSSEEEEEDVVYKTKAPKLRGMLAIRKSSDEDDSEDDSDHEMVEDLIDESLEQIQAQEVEEAKTAAPKAAAKAMTQVRGFLDVLREIPFFAQFSEEHQTQLFAELEETRFLDGDSIVKQGEVGDKFYTIVEGEAVVSKMIKETGEDKDLTHIYVS